LDRAGQARCGDVNRWKGWAELGKYLDIARIADLVDLKTSSDDAQDSKAAPDIFQIVLKTLGIQGADAVAIGDTPYDAAAAGEGRS
jgi:beta-phosphoglucomutase-like phosphatase (HAD superfamily)